MWSVIVLGVDGKIVLACGARSSASVCVARRLAPAPRRAGPAALRRMNARAHPSPASRSRCAGTVGGSLAQSQKTSAAVVFIDENSIRSMSAPACVSATITLRRRHRRPPSLPPTPRA